MVVSSFIDFIQGLLGAAVSAHGEAVLQANWTGCLVEVVLPGQRPPTPFP